MRALALFSRYTIPRFSQSIYEPSFLSVDASPYFPKSIYEPSLTSVNTRAITSLSRYDPSRPEGDIRALASLAYENFHNFHRPSRRL